MAPVVRITYGDNCDSQFQSGHHHEFQEWLDNNNQFMVNDSVMVFDEAYVLNGLHVTTSLRDPNPIPHVTVRLSNAELRAEDAWYTLHWRPRSGSVYLPRPDNREAYENRVAGRRAREHRRRERQKRREEQQAESEPHPSRVSEAGHLSAPESLEEAHVASTGGGRSAARGGGRGRGGRADGRGGGRGRDGGRGRGGRGGSAGIGKSRGGRDRHGGRGAEI